MDSLGVFVDQTYSKSGQIRLCRPVRLLRSVVQNPDSESNCLSVSDWCELVLFPAKRGGKRHDKRPRGCVCGPTCPTKARSLCTSSCFAAYITHMSHSRVQQPNWKTAAVMTRQQCVRPWVLLNCRRSFNPPASLNLCHLTDLSDFMPLEVQEHDVSVLD